MALTGLQIQKLLPKTNCKECGSNTCLAFAMRLASKKANLSECPYASEEAKQILGAASEPPVKTVCFGSNKELRLGDETVLYRHEKTFVNQTLIAINIDDTQEAKSMNDTLEAIKNYELVRVGETLTIEMVSVTDKSGDSDTFANAVKAVWQKTSKPVIMCSANTGALKKAAEAIKGSGSLIACADQTNWKELKEIAAQNDHVLAVTAPDLDGITQLTEQIRNDGFDNIMVNFQTGSLAEQFQTNSIARRMAIKQNYKPLGYTSLKFIHSGDFLEDTVMALTEISKYGGICVLPEFNPAQLVGLMTLRLNIFTDPQKPIQVDPKPYPIGEPDRKSPVFVTTNFSLTYFIVSGEIENSGISAWLVVPQCEGMSVLTAWAAGKFSGSSIGKAIKEMNFEEQVDTRDIVIPGYVSQISGELEENLPGWKVLVGPQEAADLESFIKLKFAG